jgi:Domain of unknown function (DUF4412)
MKLLNIAAAVLAAAPMWAGVRVKVDVTDTKTGKVTEQQEILLDADRLRINSTNKNQTFLFLTDGGRDRIVMLDQTRNEYREIDQQTMNQATQQMQGAMAQLQSQLANLPPEQRARVEQMLRGRMGQAGKAAPAERTIYTAKGSDSVNGFSCTRYEGVLKGEKTAEVCASRPSDVHFSQSDFQVFEKMRQFSADLVSSNPLLSGAKTSYLMNPGFEGYPVETINYSGGQATTKWEVKSIEHTSFSDADFSLGAAKKMDLFPGRGNPR